MKSLFAIIIILGLLYFGFTAISNSNTMNQPRQSDKLDEYGLSDLKGDVPDGAHGALLDVNTDVNTGIQGFFGKINDTINDARSAIHSKNSVSFELE